MHVKSTFVDLKHLASKKLQLPREKWLNVMISTKRGSNIITLIIKWRILVKRRNSGNETALDIMRSSSFTSKIKRIRHK